MFKNIYKNKKVLITGHTGFKGAWLSVWLIKLGAQVSGFSNKVPTKPSLFEVARLSQQINHKLGDVRDLATLKSVIEEIRPDYIFHLAAQAIVSTSYSDPIETISTNVLGVANLLEALRNIGHHCNVVIVTSDKCYENVEWPWGYREIDHLGGKDIYSGSKAAAEVVFHSYFHSFFSDNKSNVRLATGRAGNVIGGGDWGKDRIVVDCMRSWAKDEQVDIRSPCATRPWQHVLEPLSGYLTLGAALSNSHPLSGESFNFGPRSEQNRTVLELITDLSKYWGFRQPEEAYRVAENIPFRESSLLKLNCDKSLFHLKWVANLDYADCVKFVGEWYYGFYRDSADGLNITLKQIEQYEMKAKNQGLIWTM